MKFLIRDDDTCAFTTPEDLKACYDGIWERVPVGLAVTPYRIPGKFPNVPAEIQESGSRVGLDTNPDIVAFLKEANSQGKAQVLLHGFDHSLPGGLPEYIGGKDLLAKTRQGKEYLEALLDCTLDTFVPPNNGIRKEGFEAVVASGLNLLNVPGLLRPSHRPLGPENISNFLKVNYFRRFKGMKYPHVLHFRDHMEMNCHAVTPSQNLEDLMDAFVNCQRENGVFIVAIHYHAFERKLKSGESLRQALEILLDLAEGVPGIQFPTFHQLWESTV